MLDVRESRVGGAEKCSPSVAEEESYEEKEKETSYS